MKNKTVINTPLNSAVLLPTSGNRARNRLFQLEANHVSSTSVQYVIDGINDQSVNKSILYNAKDLKEFKEKLKCYEKISEKSGKPKIYEHKSKYPIG